MFKVNDILVISLGKKENDVVRIIEVDVDEEVYRVESLVHRDLLGEVYFDQDNVYPAPWFKWRVRRD